MSSELVTTAQATAFVQALLPWQRAHGRHDLPWQATRDPYRVWLSEIMLQQTQVATVKSYYAAFLNRFPTVSDLAEAEVSEVMALWAGLGYYSRARNLHACAQQVMRDWGGQFPSCAQDLQSLKGIGPSTAAAIASFCFGQRVSILDGNVKRVLARWLALEVDVSTTRAAKSLNAIAQRLAQAVSDAADMPTFTQGLMDLGATVCQPHQARCERCPLASTCSAHAQSDPLRWPLPKARLKRQSLRWRLVFVSDGQGQWAWQPRPAQGIWGGLMAPQVLEQPDQLEAWAAGYCAHVLDELPMFKHVLTHRDLMLYPVVVRVERLVAPADWSWCDAPTVQTLGLPAGVLRVWLNDIAPRFA